MINSMTLCNFYNFLIKDFGIANAVWVEEAESSEFESTCSQKRSRW